MADDKGWDSKWSSGAGWLDKPTPVAGKDIAKAQLEQGNISLSKDEKVIEALTNLIKDNWPEAPKLTGWDLGTEERTIIYSNSVLHEIILQKELKLQGSNLVDDQAYLYFQCENCSSILDPHTKSFKTLQDKRAEAGWIVKWNVNGQGYKVYCTECWDEAL